MQNLYNLSDRHSETVLDYCTAENIGFIPWYPLATGSLANPDSPLSSCRGATRCDSRSAGTCVVAQEITGDASDSRHVQGGPSRKQYKSRPSSRSTTNSWRSWSAIYERRPALDHATLNSNKRKNPQPRSHANPQTTFLGAARFRRYARGGLSSSPRLSSRGRSRGCRHGHFPRDDSRGNGWISRRARSRVQARWREAHALQPHHQLQQFLRMGTLERGSTATRESWMEDRAVDG